MNDLAKKKESELHKLLQDKKKRLQEMHFSLSRSKPGEESVSSVKKDIARILTELNSRSTDAK